MNVLEIDTLQVSLVQRHLRIPIVRDVSFSVRRGETVCVVGESGCGKSLTALSIMGLLPRNMTRSVQTFRLDGLNVLECTPSELRGIRGRHIGMIFQEPMTSLNPCLTIGTQLIETYRAHGMGSRSAGFDRAIFLLGRTGIKNPHERMRQYPHQLSGGLRQRVMIAMALMCGPGLIIADEPTTALDVVIQSQILALLRELQLEFGLGIMLITHDLGVVARMAHRVLVMYAGQIVEEGPSSLIFSGPSHPYTRALLDCIPGHGRVKPGSRLPTIPGQVPPVGTNLRVCSFLDRCGLARGDCNAEISLQSGSNEIHKYRCIHTST